MLNWLAFTKYSLSASHGANRNAYILPDGRVYILVSGPTAGLRYTEPGTSPASQK